MTTLSLAVTLAACGGGDDDGGGGTTGDTQPDSPGEAATKTFSDDDFGLTFRYLDGYDEQDVGSVAKTAGEGEAVARRAVVVGGDSGIIVTRFEVTVAAGDETVDAIQAELDDVVTELAGGPIAGRRTTIGGFTAFQYDDIALTSPENGSSDLTFLFEGTTQYQLNCQSEPEYQDRVDEACALALQTIQPA